MIRQAEHLAALVALPNIALGIVPWTRPTNRPILHAFQIYDERAAMLGTETSVALITDTRDVADFATRFEIYAGFADYGDTARAVFDRTANEYLGAAALSEPLTPSLLTGSSFVLVGIALSRRTPPIHNARQASRSRQP